MLSSKKIGFTLKEGRAKSQVTHFPPCNIPRHHRRNKQYEKGTNKQLILLHKHKYYVVPDRLSHYPIIPGEIYIIIIAFSHMVIAGRVGVTPDLPWV